MRGTIHEREEGVKDDGSVNWDDPDPFPRRSEAYGCERARPMTVSSFALGAAVLLAFNVALVFFCAVTSVLFGWPY
jgi:hypothetical protein